LAVADPKIDLRLVTTVSGNTDAATATALTFELLDRLGAPPVPVHQGASRALLHPASRFGQLPDGMAVRAPEPGPGALALVEAVLAAPGELTLVAIGPLTNVALAMLLEPSFAESLADLVVMGGVFAGTTGRTDMPGEFNVWSDPHAAHIVLQSGVMATWVGLDVTRRVRLTRAEAAAMAADPHPFTAFAGRYSTAWIDHLAETEEPKTDSCALHDPLAVAAVTRPDLLQVADVHLDVQLDGVARGVMVADRQPRPEDVNARIAVDVDPAGFADHFTRCLQRL
jgi:purine nucleosidase